MDTRSIPENVIQDYSQSVVSPLPATGLEDAQEHVTLWVSY